MPTATLFACSPLPAPLPPPPRRAIVSIHHQPGVCRSQSRTPHHNPMFELQRLTLCKELWHYEPKYAVVTYKLMNARNKSRFNWIYALRDVLKSVKIRFDSRRKRNGGWSITQREISHPRKRVSWGAHFHLRLLIKTVSIFISGQGALPK